MLLARGKNVQLETTWKAGLRKGALNLEPT